MKSRQCSRRYARAGQSGFTIVELLVASALGLLIVALALSTSLANRIVYRQDLVRTRMNQNLRSALDIMALNVRQAGEGFEDGFFPAVEIIDGGLGAPDELIIRRNLYADAVFNLCQDLNAGTSTPTIRVAYNTATPECRYGTEYAPLISTWSNHITDEGGSALAYMYNTTARAGEFFRINLVEDAGTQVLIHRQGGTWAQNYTGNGTGGDVFILEEFHFRLTDNVLELIHNDDEDNILNVVDAISDFQITAYITGGVPRTTFGASDGWTTLEAIEATLSSRQNFSGRELDASISSRFFPRNVLSF